MEMRVKTDLEVQLKMSIKEFRMIFDAIGVSSFAEMEKAGHDRTEFYNMYLDLDVVNVQLRKVGK